MKYPLPNKNHEVVKDIETLQETFVAIDEDICALENKTANTQEKVAKANATFVHTGVSLGNNVIQDIAPRRYLAVSEDGITCVDSSDNPGGKNGQCTIKKSNANFDVGWGDIWSISKNGTTALQNASEGCSNKTHIFCDVCEIDNNEQLPKNNPVSNQVIDDYEIESNEAVCLADTLEPNFDSETFASRENRGVVKIGDGIQVTNGIISADIIQKATKTEAGIVTIGDGIQINDGTISVEEIPQATKEKFGVVKLGNDFEINASGAMEIKDMADAQIIYKLSQMKIINNGNVDLEESILIYRAFVNEDLLFKFNVNFKPKEDFTFILEIISNGSHLIGFSDQFRNGMNQLPINRGTTQLKITKRLGIPYYEIVVNKLDAPAPICLTPSVESCITSEFSITSVNGGNWMPNQILRTAYNGYSNIKELNFRFETLVCVDYVNYLSRISTIAMDEFILKGSNDGKNWTTLIYKNNEIIYGKIYTEIKGCFRYYNLKIGYTSDDNKPGGVTLWGTQVDNNESEIVSLTPYMSSNTTPFATLTASSIKSGSAAEITGLNCGSLIKINKTGDDWIKYEFPEAKVANILEMNFRGTGEYYGFYGDRQTNWFKLEGSNDDETWNLLLERQYYGNEIFLENNVLFYKLRNETAYKYYRLVCLATNSSNTEWGVCGFKLYQRRLGKNHFYSSIPLLSSGNQDGYEVSASSQYSNEHAPFYAFDGDSSTKWASNGTGNQWLQVKFPDLTICNMVKITSRNDGNYNNQAPKDFEIQGSLDGEIWDTLTTQEGIAWTNQGQTQTFEFENGNAYLYYRLYITANGGDADYSLGEFSVGNSLHEYKRFLTEYTYLVPAMSSNSQDGYIASATSEYNNSEGAWRAFDRQSNQWTTKNGVNKNVELKIELPEAKICDTIMIGVSNANERIPQTFRIEASNDNSTWSVLYQSLEGANLSTNTDYYYDNPYKDTAFKYYRLYVITNKGGSFISLRQFNLIQKNEIREY